MDAIIVPLLLTTFGSLVVFLIADIGLKAQFWYQLKPLNGTYKGYNPNGNPLSKDPTFYVSYKIWKKMLVLSQKSETRGSWTSTIQIESILPKSTGVYKYETGKYVNHWGIHELTINLKECQIHVVALGRNNKGNAEYILKKRD